MEHTAGSRHCPNKLSVLTQGHGGKSATFLSGGVEATTASGEATMVTSRPGGVKATTFSDEAQSGHVANDSYGTEEPGKNTKPGKEKEEQVAKDSYETEWKARTNKEGEQSGDPTSTYESSSGKGASRTGSVAKDGYGSGGTEYYKCKNKKTNEHGIIEGGGRPNGSQRYDEWVCDRCTKRKFMFKAECRRCKAPPNEAQRTTKKRKNQEPPRK